jgi:microcystin-dependent protein
MRRFLSWLVPLHLHALPVASSSPAATVTFGAGAFVASLARGDGPTDVSRRNSARAVPSAILPTGRGCHHPHQPLPPVQGVA